MSQELRPLWRKFFGFNWIFGLVLLLIVCVPRFILVLHANVTNNYGSIAIIMIASALAPFIFLSKIGRQTIGWKKPVNYSWLGLAFLAGLAVSAVVYLIGDGLYGDSLSNWYTYIGTSYNLPQELSAQDRKIYFIIFAVSGMIFSPIGEELFFRGIVHSSFAASLGEKQASIIDSLSFALTHLAHFGIIYSSGSWNFLLMPALLWVILMFLTSLVFIKVKQKTGSLVGAIVSHSGFNLTMTYFIFYSL